MAYKDEWIKEQRAALAKRLKAEQKAKRAREAANKKESREHSISLQRYVREQKKAIRAEDRKKEAYENKMEKTFWKGIAAKEKQNEIDREKKKQRVSNVADFIFSAGASNKKSRKRKGKFRKFIIF